MKNMMPKGIRPYGPGKFNTLLDSYASTVTLDGGADEEAHTEGSGYYGFVRLDHSFRGAVRDAAEENNDDLTPAELTMLDTAVAIIFHERTDGIVESDWFDNMDDADEQWAAIEEEVNAEYEDSEEEDE